MEEHFVIIRIFQNTHLAYISRDRLLFEGISSWISDENSLIYNPFFATSLGGARLWVSEKDATRAEEVLISIEKIGNT